MTDAALMQALMLADEASPAPALAASALRTLRRELAHARGLTIQELIDQAVNLGPITEKRFSHPMSEDDTKTATNTLLDSRRAVVVIGDCSISWDTNANVLWGVDPHGVESIRAVGDDAAAVERALLWASSVQALEAVSL
ncbi:hypothetical protein [Xanthomonas campestris]|uniref:hypothetical protein n=1 Tax=Xanthomonas campestris TaxID=339 RepID=UPI002B23D2E3|nr:hypothetical protein [Xanthomonas campestris]MEA9776957.1 hypothetical protein [Xanthomonas campestris pv. raphani]